MSAERQGGAVAAMRRPGMRRLWAGFALSLTGDGMFFVAIAWVALDLAKGPTALSWIAAAWTIGFISATPIAGTLADRRSRRSVLVAADLVRGLALLGMAATAFSAEPSLVLLCALSFVHGSGDALFLPAIISAVASLAGPDHLVGAASVEQAARPLFYRLAGPVLGGLVIAVWSAAGALLIDGISFLLCAVLLAGLPKLAPTGPIEVAKGTIRQAIRYARGQPWLLAGMIAGATSNVLFWASIEVFIPTQMKDTLGGTAVQYGAMLAANGAGGIVGAFILSTRLSGRAPRLLHAVSGWTLGGLALGGYALAPSPWVMLLPAFAFGLGMGVGVGLWTAVVQSRVPDGMLGRVSALDAGLSQLLTPFALVAAGPLLTLVSSRSALAGAAALCVTAVTLPFLLLLRRPGHG